MPAEAAVAEPGQAQKAGFWQTVKAVLSAFIGIRRSSEHAAASLSPGRVIVVAVAAAALFVAALLSVVNWVVG